MIKNHHPRKWESFCRLDFWHRTDGLVIHGTRTSKCTRYSTNLYSGTGVPGIVPQFTAWTSTSTDRVLNVLPLVPRPVVGLFLEVLGLFRDFSASLFHTKSHSFLIVTHINWYSLESEFHDLSDATLITKNRQILEALYPFKIRVFKILSNSSKFRFF